MIRFYKLIFVLLFVLHGKMLVAQPMGFNNAVWHYSLYNIFPPYDISPVILTAGAPFYWGSNFVTYISISSIIGCSFSPGFVVYQSNDSVYYYLPVVNQPVMLYNYNAQIGDTQTIYGLDVFDQLISDQLLVTDTGSVTINGNLKRTYTVLNLTGYFQFGGLIIEDIGCTSYLFPQYAFCDPLVTGIRCYEDTVNGFINFNPAIACDSVIYLGIAESIASSQISVSPNPFEDELNISIDSGQDQLSQVRILNILGEEVYNEPYSYPQGLKTFNLNLGFLESGSYFLELTGTSSSHISRIFKL